MDVHPEPVNQFDLLAIALSAESLVSRYIAKFFLPSAELVDGLPWCDTGDPRQAVITQSLGVLSEDLNYSAQIWPTRHCLIPSADLARLRAAPMNQ